MKLIIDIPEFTYEEVCKTTLTEENEGHLFHLITCVRNGIPLEPQPKTGHWILIDKELSRYKCSECGEIIRLNKKNEILSLEKDETLNDYPYSHCGAKMQEVEE